MEGARRGRVPIGISRRLLQRVDELDADRWPRWVASVLCGLWLVGLVFLAGAAPAAQPIHAIGVESQYADVIAQIGGPYVRVTSIETNPNIDPHGFEVSPRIAAAVASAQLIVTNGLGYDDWAAKIIAAAPRAGRGEVSARHVMGLPDRTLNPHLWYDPKVMPVLAGAIASRLIALEPDEAASFNANLARFDASLHPWYAAIAALRTQCAGAKVAVTEPVADYLLKAAGCAIATPPSLQAAIMNGTDPSPQDVATQQALLTGHRVKVLAYNSQVTGALTRSFLDLARKNGVPVVAVYETMPTGYHYQGWMLAEVVALRRAIADGVSTTELQATAR